MLGQITAAPPQQFLRLATLDPDSYANLRASLRRVPGLVVRPQAQRLFQAEATGLVGAVGSELNERLRADGALYAPGTTIGLSGLEQKYQRQLLGTPTTEVVAVNSAGQQTGVLAQWPGAARHAGADHDQLGGPERGPGRSERRCRTRVRSSR